MAESANLPIVYKVEDIMSLLGISKNTAYRLIKGNLFPVLKIKSMYRIPKSGFDMWVNNIHQTN